MYFRQIRDHFFAKFLAMLRGDTLMLSEDVTEMWA